VQSVYATATPPRKSSLRAWLLQSWPDNPPKVRHNSKGRTYFIFASVFADGIGKGLKEADAIHWRTCLENLIFLVMPDIKRLFCEWVVDGEYDLDARR